MIRGNSLVIWTLVSFVSVLHRSNWFVATKNTLNGERYMLPWGRILLLLWAGVVLWMESWETQMWSSLVNLGLSYKLSQNYLTGLSLGENKGGENNIQSTDGQNPGKLRFALVHSLRGCVNCEPSQTFLLTELVRFMRFVMWQSAKAIERELTAWTGNMDFHGKHGTLLQAQSLNHQQTSYLRDKIRSVMKFMPALVLSHLGNLTYG